MNRQLLIASAFSIVTAITSPAHAVFIGASNGDLYNLNVSTNTSTLLGNSGVGAMFDIAQDPITSNLYGMGGGTALYSINKTNGAATFIGNAGAVINGLTFDSSGTLYGSGSTALYTVNTSTGLASTVGTTGFASSGDLAFDTSGNLYMSASGGDRLISLNAVTGAGTLIGNIGFTSVYGLNFSGSTLYGFTVGGQTLAINTSTGAGTQLAVNGISAFGADGAGGVSVPEPSVLALLSLGLVGLGLARRRAA